MKKARTVKRHGAAVVVMAFDESGQVGFGGEIIRRLMGHFDSKAWKLGQVIFVFRCKFFYSSMFFFTLSWVGQGFLFTRQVNVFSPSKTYIPLGAPLNVDRLPPGQLLCSGGTLKIVLLLCMLMP